MYKSVTVHRTSGVFKHTFRCNSYYAVRIRGSSKIYIYDCDGSYIGKLSKNMYGLGNNHIIFETIFNDSFFLVVNGKYGDLDNVRIYDGVTGDDSGGIEMTHDLVSKSDICFMFPYHGRRRCVSVVDSPRLLRLYKNCGSVSGLCVFFNSNSPSQQEDYAVVMNAACMPSKKNVVCRCGRYFLYSCFKIGDHCFRIKFNKNILTELYSFILFLTYCF